MKKILHLITTGEVGGAETLCINIIKNISNEFDCVYCSPSGSIRNKMIENNIKYCELSTFSLSEVRKAINAIQPDIIHAHDIRASVYAALGAKDIPVVSHIHGKFEDMSRISFRSLLYMMVVPKISKIICVSKSVYCEFKWQKVINEKGILLENKIDLNEIKNRLNSIIDGPKYDFVFLGRLEKVKNPFRYIRLIKHLQKSNPNISACIVGNGSMYEECAKYIKEENISIDLLGFQKEPLKFIKNCKALVMTSIAEGIPLAALETLSCGKPIISTPTDGLCDIIHNGKNGFICNNDEEFIKCMTIIINEEKKYNQLISYIKNNNTNEFEEYIKQIEKVYSSIERK